MTSTLDKQKELVKEALEFAKFVVEDVEAELKGQIVHWTVRLEGIEYRINGQYQLDEEYDRMSVITTVALARHIYGQAIFDLLTIAEHFHHVNPQRNTLSELVVRFMIAKGLKKGVLSNNLIEWFKTETNWKQNVTEQEMSRLAFTRKKI